MDGHRGLRLPSDISKNVTWRNAMVDPATITAIIGTVSAAVGLVDKVTDSFIKYKTGRGDPVPKEHRMKITAASDGKSLVGLEHGRETQRVTYDQLIVKMSNDDLRYIRALEKSMNVHFSIWEEVYPQLASESNPITKAKLKQQLDSIVDDMGNDLTKILGFVEMTGLYLDDHYQNIRHIAKSD
jgi:hypothetical protein